MEKALAWRDSQPGRLHPRLLPEERRRLLWLGVEELNRGHHFTAHEAFEEVWRSQTPDPRDLWQGLVQLAAALHHVLELGHVAGPRRLLVKARRRLEPYAPEALGLDIDALLGELDAWASFLEGAAGERPALPQLRVLEPDALR